MDKSSVVRLHTLLSMMHINYRKCIHNIYRCDLCNKCGYRQQTKLLQFGVML